MAAKLQHEIHRKKPFEHVEVEAALSLFRTADLLGRWTEPVLKEAGLSGTQYNVLRILRGHRDDCSDGMACGEISEQMISREPDMTRLLDRLEARGLIVRQRSLSDRRVVRSQITEKGVAILRDLDEPMLQAHKKQFAHVGETKLRQLIELLEDIRNGPWAVTQ